MAFLKYHNYPIVELLSGDLSGNLVILVVDGRSETPSCLRSCGIDLQYVITRGINGLQLHL